eukprot:CAMPEP_0194068860 /NCGR_PEP_ID=MMETSP0009_2-20130614/87323_1 /TAXON_ID=210454 /ORGANISM="Grammatophora oceanica, Strain CCMP 410" /LENGTH=1075 /DNA_ID=CAMNT_0038721995 /DNA_START=103 /DNA_END=3327 /DNA_ORIENTATION=-
MKLSAILLSLQLLATNKVAANEDQKGSLRASKPKGSNKNLHPFEVHDSVSPSGGTIKDQFESLGATTLDDHRSLSQDEACNPENSFLVFTGHDEACSWKKGWVNITWSPAFVYEVSTEELIWCGDYTYDVFVGRGDREDNIYEGLEIDQLIDGTTWDHYETAETNLIVENYEAGENYHILVTARTSRGHSSFNRKPAEIEMSRTDPVWKDDYEGWMNMPHPKEGEFDVDTRVDLDGRQVVTFFGPSIPQSVRDILPNYHIYIFTSGGESDFGRAVQLLVDTEDIIEWVYEPADLSAVFEEMEVTMDVHDTAHGANLDDYEEHVDLDPAEDDELEEMLENMTVEQRMHLCKHAYPDRELFDCFRNDPEEELEEFGRMLMTISEDNPQGRVLFRRCCRRLKKAVKKVKKVAKKVTKVVVNTAGKVAEKVKDVVEAIADAEISIDRTQTFLSIEKGGKMSCFDDQLQVGIGFDASANAQLKITVGIFDLDIDAEIRFFGGIGVQAYGFLDASIERIFKPDPVVLFETSNDVIIQVGPVPILITHRPSVSAFLEASLNVEAQALIPVSFGYDYELKFMFKDGKSSVAQSFDRRDPPEEDPVFEARLAFEADVGVALEWQVLFFRLIQASLAVDVGLNLETEVSTNLDTILITQPYFYVLDRFNVDFFIRLRAALGLNDDIGDAIKDIKGDKDSDSKLCEFRAVPYEIPSFEAEDPNVPDIFIDAVSKAQADGKSEDEMTLGDFLAEAGVEDKYTGKKQKLTGPQKDFSINFELFREDFTLLGIPDVSLKASGEAQFCTNGNAIVLPMKSILSTTGLALKGIIDGEWFVNLDGDLFGEDTPWTVAGGDTGSPAITLELPRSAASDGLFQIDENASVFYRATPQLLPFPPNSLFAKGLLADLFPEVVPFDGEWFVNLDGDLFGEDTPWTVAGGDTGSPVMALELPRSAASDGLFQIDENASVFYRATPQLLPFPPNSLFAKGLLADLFPEVVPFECCEDVDCSQRNEASTGISFMCNSNRQCEEVAEGTGGGGLGSESESSGGSSGTTDTQDSSLTVFVTSNRFNGGQIGGLEGADDKCQA